MTYKRKITALVFLIATLLCMDVFAANQTKPVTLKGDTITYDSTTGISVAEGNVVIIQEDGQATAAYAEYNLKTKIGWLEGNVHATKGEMALSAAKVWIREQNHITAEGLATVSKAGDSVTAPRIDYWSENEFAKTSGGWGKLSQADGSILTADYIEYDMKKGLGTAQANVKIDSPARNLTGAGDKATYTAGTKDKPGEFILTGNAWLIQDGNKVVGNQLIVKSDSSESAAKGNVVLDLQPKQKNDANSTESDKTAKKE